MGSYLSTDTDVAELENLLLIEGKLVPVPYKELNKFKQEQISMFCHKHGIYQIPTDELIIFLKNEIGSEKAIELGSGNGCIGRNLNIHMFDNHMQNWPKISSYYQEFKQPTVKYGVDVEEMDGNAAVKLHRPKIVIACWLTQKWYPGMSSGNEFGVDERQMFSDGIEKYVHVGNEKTHGLKELFHDRIIRHERLKFPWLLSRSMYREKNEIYIFKNKS